MSIKKIHSEYIKRKNDYCDLTLKSLCFHFILYPGHSSIKTMKHILKSKWLKPNPMEIEGERKNIPGKIHFDEPRHSSPHHFIISSSVIEDNSFVSYQCYDYYDVDDLIPVNKNDTQSVKIKLIKKIKNKIWNDVLFEKKIDIEKHVIGITCYESDKQDLQLLLDKYNYKNIQIYTLRDLPKITK